MDLKNDIQKIIPLVSKPGRYTGGEYGSIVKENDNNLLIAISYPDLYEIGMSNIAIKILYNIINQLEHVTCERVFTPAPDLELELRKRNFPLFSLESGRPLSDFDIIGFSLGYELTATNLLNILDLGQIQYLRKQRSHQDPIIMTGGPAVTNPLPFAKFIDYAFIGEAEDFVRSCFTELAAMKKQGASRQDFHAVLFSNPSIWSANDNKKKVKRGIYSGFGDQPGNTIFPIPNIKIIQDHGNVEIMRGCPNGCRFCHAGFFYRPYRLKEPSQIENEIAQLIFKGGYREITLSSLSTGDYPHLEKLVSIFDYKFRSYGVSFSLPSLRINSVSLDILHKITKVRKSGLTFAVETPEMNWQLGLNKQVSIEKTIQLLTLAEEKGWRIAKFYFMLGLPMYDIDESDLIVNFLKEIKSRTKINFNVNVSAFVPKPHTPFQWSAQITEMDTNNRIQKIKSGLMGRGFKVGYHAPFASILEGLFARGDERLGDIIADAFKQGARLDAWEEYLNRDLWKEVIESHKLQNYYNIHQKKKMGQQMPWDNIDLGVTKEFLISEFKKALDYKSTPACSSHCNDNCGICNKKEKVKAKIRIREFENRDKNHKEKMNDSMKSMTRLLLSFSKKGRAIYLSHLNCMTIFERSFARAGYMIKFTQGFNPKPRLEFASPLSLGITSEQEWLLLELENYDDDLSFRKKVNSVLPAGFIIITTKTLKPYCLGDKKISLASIFWGSDYRITKPDEPVLMKKLLYLLQTKNMYLEALIKYHYDQDALFIRWKKVNKKGYNIIRFLESLLENNPFQMGVEITRLATLALKGEKMPDTYNNVLE